MMLKEKCQMTDSEWEERAKGPTIGDGGDFQSAGCLDGNDAHDLLSKVFNPALVQEGSTGNRSGVRRHASP